MTDGAMTEAERKAYAKGFADALRKAAEVAIGHRLNKPLNEAEKRQDEVARYIASAILDLTPAGQSHDG